MRWVFNYEDADSYGIGNGKKLCALSIFVSSRVQLLQVWVEEGALLLKVYEYSICNFQPERLNWFSVLKSEVRGDITSKWIRAMFIPLICQSLSAMFYVYSHHDS